VNSTLLKVFSEVSKLAGDPLAMLSARHHLRFDKKRASRPEITID
jgi:hypothetical protein